MRISFLDSNLHCKISDILNGKNLVYWIPKCLKKSTTFFLSFLIATIKGVLPK